MKKKYSGEDSENEFSVDEPEEFQESDDDWTPGAGEGGRRSSRRLRGVKKPKLAEPSSSDEEGAGEGIDEEEDGAGSEDSEASEKKKKSPKKAKTPGKGRGRGAAKKPAASPKPKDNKVAVVGENIQSCEATSTTTNTTSGPTIIAPTEKEFTSGAFVVLKTDFQNGGDPPIWKIDGKALLQKYVPFEQDGKTLYKNTSTYSGWSINNKEMYYPAPIVFKMQNRKETIIEFLKDKIKQGEDSE